MVTIYTVDKNEISESLINLLAVVQSVIIMTGSRNWRSYLQKIVFE